MKIICLVMGHKNKVLARDHSFFDFVYFLTYYYIFIVIIVVYVFSLIMAFFFD